MKRALQGKYLKVTTAGEAVRAFVPAPLPPRPAIEWSPAQDNLKIESLGRAAASALVVHLAMQRQPITSATSLAQVTKLTPATVNKSLSHLQALGIARELTQKLRGRVFSYAAHADILNEGMELPDTGGRVG